MKAKIIALQPLKPSLLRRESSKVFNCLRDGMKTKLKSIDAVIISLLPLHFNFPNIPPNRLPKVESTAMLYTPCHVVA